MRRWTTDEVEMFENMTDEEIAKETGRTVNAVRIQRYKVDHKGVKGSSIEYVAYDKKGRITASAPSIVELGKMIDRSPNTISRALNRYNHKPVSNPLYAKIDISEVEE